MIPILELIRLEDSYSFGTFGALKINKSPFCWTLERPDIENYRNVSSIPAQQYTCNRRTSPKFGETFQVMDVPGRDHILFHPANLVEELEGCIALGSRIGILDGKRAVLSSGDTFKRFMKSLEGIEAFHLTISEVF